MTEHITAALTRLSSQVQWWQDQAAQVEHDRANLRYVVPAGAALGACIAFFHLAIGLGVFGVAVVVWTMGLYMTTVRRSEFRENLAEARANLRTMQADIDAQRTAVDGSDPAAGGLVDSVGAQRP